MPDAVTCRSCGAVNPPPEQTCKRDRDHYIGVGGERACRHCGRLAEACSVRPCQAVRAMWHAIEDGGDGGGGDGS